MQWTRIRQILTLALPIIGGMISQNILNLIDTAMVGHLGDAALAAVGIGGFVTFMATALITGLSSGVQAMSARRLGEGRVTQTATPLNGGLLLAVGVGLPMTALSIALVPWLVPLLVEDVAVQAVGIPYMQVRMAGIVAVGCNFVFRGYWNGVNRSGLYMRTLVVMHATNVILNYALIFGNLGAPELGATGAGLATVIALYVGTLYYFWMGLSHAREGGFLRALPDRVALRTMARLAIPAGIQNLFFSAGMTTFFVIVGRVGTAQLAASQVLVNLLLVGLLPGIGFGLAAASMVGQSLGRGQPDEAMRWGWEVARLAMGVIALLSVPALIWPELLLMPFIKTPETLALARAPLRLIAATLWLDIGGNVLLNALLGAGDSRRVMVVSVLMQWGIGLPLAALAGPVLGWGVLAIWGVQCGYRAVQALIFAIIWRRGAWARVEV